MGIALIDEQGNIPYGQKNYWISKDDDLSSIPTRGLLAGSCAISKATGHMFIYNLEDDGKWDLFMGGGK